MENITIHPDSFSQFSASDQHTAQVPAADQHTEQLSTADLAVSISAKYAGKTQQDIRL